MAKIASKLPQNNPWERTAPPGAAAVDTAGSEGSGVVEESGTVEVAEGVTVKGRLVEASALDTALELNGTVTVDVAMMGAEVALPVGCTVVSGSLTGGRPLRQMLAYLTSSVSLLLPHISNA